MQQIAARHRQTDVYVVHDEERLLLALVWETGQVVRNEQQHVYFCLLQKEKKDRRARFTVLHVLSYTILAPFITFLSKTDKQILLESLKYI